MSMAQPLYNPGQPYLHYIPGGFSNGKIAHITGTFSTTVNSIVIKFQSGPNGDPSDDIGICLFGRSREGLLGCNSFTRHGGWGQEEAKSTYFISPNSQFDMTILCDPVCFKIAINRQHFTEYQHRVNPGSLSYLNVASGPNNLILNCLWIEDPFSGNTFSSNAQPHSHSTTTPVNENKGHKVPYGGHSSGHGKSSGLVNQAINLGGGLLAAKTAKKSLFGGGKMMKYGVPLAGAAVGGYALKKGLGGIGDSFDFDDSFDCGGSFDCGSDSD